MFSQVSASAIRNTRRTGRLVRRPPDREIGSYADLLVLVGIIGRCWSVRLPWDVLAAS